MLKNDGYLVNVTNLNVPMTVCDGTIESSAIFLLHALNVNLDVNLKIHEQVFVFCNVL